MDNKELLELGSLEYITDSSPGITRKREGTHFVYYYPDNTQVKDTETLERIKSLAIPPAYKDVWIAPSNKAHIQATGRDSKNRKQYRYHSSWQTLREKDKFMSMCLFGKELSKVRRYVSKELNKPLKIDKEQIMCAIIYLMDNYFIRVGNVIYERENKSYGLTTLRKKHLSLNTSEATLKFPGKNSKAWEIVLHDKKIIKLLKKCESLPGYKLFKYIDAEQNAHEITSQDINNFLQKITKQSFTAKDFRTWGACRETFYYLCKTPYISEGEAKKQLSLIITKVAILLGHSAAICQKSYIYPEIIAHWKTEKINVWIKERKLTSNKDRLFLQWLETHFAPAE